jgi:anthranilate synthase component 2
MKVLIIDNYDSFVYNLAQYVGEMGSKPSVFRNDKITVKQILEDKPDRIIISPGPGTPYSQRYFGVCGEIIRNISLKIPTLGVCLGHQGIACVFGGNVIHAKRLMHGKTSKINHDGQGVLKGLPNPFEGTRYHSLVVERKSLPSSLKVTAFSMDDNEVMGIRHQTFPIEGIQFHPESITTDNGRKIIKNFLEADQR